MDDLVVHGCAGAKGGAFSRPDDAREDFQEHRGAGISHIVVDLSKIRHDIGCQTTVGDHVVYACFLRHMSPHHVDHQIHGFHAIKCAATAVWCTRSMR